MKKKLPLVMTIGLAALIAIGQSGLAEESENNQMGNMMNGNGIMSMMDNVNISKMMNAMNSPEGKNMIDACGDYMESFGEEEREEK
ncbi:hypothetical protein ACE1TI_18215 [Alteribacillus sp. JSM 102045]|uniref:hypothetical protein n=1 Tax=Alteribacillus sp. JSM 102045 TaxID=1562101 RepID=UPI0035BF7752